MYPPTGFDPLAINFQPNLASAYSQQSQQAAQGMTSPSPTGASPLGAGFGLNMDTARLGVGALGTIGNLWMAYQAQNLAEEQFDYTKDITDQNMSNQIQSYNTTLADKIRSRVFTENGKPGEARDYIRRNRLTKDY